MIRPYATAFRAMGCQFNVWLETASDGEQLLRQVPAWVEAIEAPLSRFRPASELNRLNAQSGSWVIVGETLLEAVCAAKQAARLTGGLYNPLVLPALAAAGYDRSFDQIGAGAEGRTDHAAPAVPDWRGIQLDLEQSAICLPRGAGIDLGGIGKGLTAEIIASRLAPYGPCLVDAGGDLVARGAPTGQPGWQVGIAEPDDSTDEPSALVSVLLTDTALATSGIDYRRWQANGQIRHHLIDPRTGEPAITDVQTISVMHRRAVTAEAYAKAALLLGSENGLDWINRQWDTAALIVRQDGEALATSTFLPYVLDGILNIQEEFMS